MNDSDASTRPLHECDDQLIQILRQLYDTDLAPRFKVLITQGFIELLVNAVIDAKCKNHKKITGNSRDFPYSIKLLLLHELGLLSDNLYRVLNQLRKHRDEAAHDPFYEMSGTVVDAATRTGTLHEFCIGTICDFYNQHQAILAPVFAPTVAATGGGVVVFPVKK
jgi:hypothetical protein